VTPVQNEPGRNDRQPLAGIRVVELATGVAGPYAGKLFADFGADVVKVEGPTGDRARRAGPFPGDVENPERSAAFLHLNTNKHSVRGTPDLLGRLARWADLVLEGDGDETLAAWGIDLDDLRARRPDLVRVAVTPFGTDGPYAGWRGADIVTYAMGGPMHATGMAGREPLKLAGSVVSVQHGNVAAVAALAALTVADRHGRGPVVDVAAFETQAGSIDRRGGYLMWRQFTGVDAGRRGGHRAGVIPAGIYPTEDGYVQVLMAPNWLVRLAEDLLDDADLAARYRSPSWQDDPEIAGLLDDALHVWTLTRTKAAAQAEAQALGLGVMALNAPEDVIADLHLSRREAFRPVDHPVAGSYRTPGPPFRPTAPGWVLRRRPPLLGEHEDDLATADALPPRPTVPPSATTGLPLEGIRVLDLTVVWAGPYGTTLLGDLGADVIRVDNANLFPTATRGAVPRPAPGRARDLGELWGAFPDDDPGARPWNRVGAFIVHARNKRSVTLDLRTDLGREAFLRLVEQADVLVENNSVKVLERLGLGWEVLTDRNPRLVVVRMPSLGLDGPYAHYIGFGAHVEALCGLTHLRGYPDMDQTANASTYHMDPASGTVAAFATLAALRRRETTGVGELVEVAQSENLLNHLGDHLVDASLGGGGRTHAGNRHPTFAPQGCYPCAGDDRWVVLSIDDDEAWSALCGALDAPDLAADPGLAHAPGRRARHDEIDARIAEWTAGLDRWEATRRLQDAGIAAGPVLGDGDCWTDPHLRARSFFRPNGSEDLGTIEFPGHLWRWDGPPLRWDPINRLGADNDAVLRTVAGLDDAAIDALRNAGQLRFDYVDAAGSPL